MGRKTRQPLERIGELRRFFGVASLAHVPNVGTYAPAFRHARGRTPCQHAVAAWLCGGEHDARTIETNAFDRKRLQARLDDIRDLTQTDDPVKAIGNVQAILAECGVAFVLRPHLPKTYLTGATFRLSAESKAVLMMSIRGSWVDIFWFTLFHELCHILRHDKRRTFVDFEGIDDSEIAVQEAEADAFARDTLIRPQNWQEFTERADFSSASIVESAENLAIAPGIITGRLQREKFIPYSRHCCRVRWSWS